MRALDPCAARGLPPLPAAVNTYMARAVLEGVLPGRLWADEAGRAMHVLHPYGMSFVWGTDVAGAFEALLAHLRAGAYRTRDEWLQIDPAWGDLDWDRMLAPGQGERYTRVNFRFDPAAFAAAAPAPLSAGWQLAAMTSADFATPASVNPTAFWTDGAAFLAHGGGMCARQDGRLGAMAFSAFRFDDCLEIGIETLAPFRRLGLGRAVAHGLIRRCLSEGLTPVWSCRKENAASYALAQSLGFVPTRELPFYRLIRI